MIFQYQALDKQGNTKTDFVDAPNEVAAKQKIRSQGLYPVRLKKHDMAADASKGKGEQKSGLQGILGKISNLISLKRSSKHVGIFSRQLATLLGAGLPLPTAIADIIEQVENKHFRTVVADLKEKLEEGSSLSNALSRHRIIFSDMYINMVRVGENLGSLDEVIARLADIEEKNAQLKGKIKSAMWYPGFMLMFAVLVLVYLLTNVIPVITEMFADKQDLLPTPTKVVLALSDFFRYYWFVPVLVIIGLIAALKFYSRQPAGRKKLDQLKLKIPGFKSFYNKIIVQKFTQNLGVLLANKVDIIKSFDIVEKIVGNVIIEEKIAESSRMIKEGSSVTHALNKTGFLPKMVLGMISAGESSDKLEIMLNNIGNVYENELDMAVNSLTGLIEPIIIILMGVIIGVIVMSVMLPMMQMNLFV